MQQQDSPFCSTGLRHHRCFANDPDKKKFEMDLYNANIEIIDILTEQGESTFRFIYQTLSDEMSAYEQAISESLLPRQDTMLLRIDQFLDSLTDLSTVKAKMMASREMFGELNAFLVDHRKLMRRAAGSLSLAVAKSLSPLKFESHCLNEPLFRATEIEKVETLIGIDLFRLGRVDIATQFLSESVGGRIRGENAGILRDLSTRFDEWSEICEMVQQMDLERVREFVQRFGGFGQQSPPHCFRNIMNWIATRSVFRSCSAGQFGEALDIVRKAGDGLFSDSDCLLSIMSMFVSRQNPSSFLELKNNSYILKDIAAVLCSSMKPEQNLEEVAECFNSLSVLICVGRRVGDHLFKIGSVVRHKSKASSSEPIEFMVQSVLKSLGYFPNDPLPYHSAFVCPVIRNSDSKDNPPVRLSCGHVTSLEAATTGTRGNVFCIYCQTKLDLSLNRRILL